MVESIHWTGSSKPLRSPKLMLVSKPGITRPCLILLQTVMHAVASYDVPDYEFLRSDIGVAITITRACTSSETRSKDHTESGVETLVRLVSVGQHLEGVGGLFCRRLFLPWLSHF